MNSGLNLCAIIPVYHHGKTLLAVCKALTDIYIPCIVVDDGNDEETRNDIAAVAAALPSVQVSSLEKNSGKGAAVIRGMLLAEEQGFTHAIQVDADGQHNLSVLDVFIAEAEKNPDAVICGYPEYDESVPPARKNGRIITTIWVSIETLSRDIRDAMCGFRIYPVAQTAKIFKTRHIGKRMTFDIESLVRLHWRGLRFVFLPVGIIYPEGGISNFNMIKDNIAISAMHTRLFFGMLLRLPVLLMRKARK